jgi:hypothetical protein
MERTTCNLFLSDCGKEQGSEKETAEMRANKLVAQHFYCNGT